MLILALAACGAGVIDTNPTDGHDLDTPVTGDTDTTPAETVDGSIVTTVNETLIEGISFDLTGADTFSAETKYEATFITGGYTVSNVEGTIDGVTYVGCGDTSGTINATTSTISIPVSVNLNGDWNVDSNGHTWADAITVNPDNACQVSMIGINDGGDWINIDGRTFTWSSSHLTYTGQISDDGETVIVTMSDGNIATYTRE